ncbi:hypothetical protein FB451DRAFT_1533295 [Mycena latifolia]|nr:hypothetical protein FB451DRAFT_1533295 [Mycena latifolia]
MDCLDFVLARSQQADLHIRLSLRDFRVQDDIDVVIDNIFARIGSTSSRWVSFELKTENPVVFERVRRHCLSLDGRALRDLRISYLYMPGFSYLPEEDPIHYLPFTPAEWFSDRMPHLMHLESFCSPLNWSSVATFANLESFHFTHYRSPLSLEPSMLQSIFYSATRLRFFRLGATIPFEWPSSVLLHSTSLRAVDLQFYHGPLAASILSAMVVPNLTELLVRDVGAHGGYLLSCSAQMRHLSHFGIRSWFQDRAVLYQPVFATYCEWAFGRLVVRQPNYAANLTELFVGCVDLNLVALLVFVIARYPLYADIYLLGPESFSIDSGTARQLTLAPSHSEHALHAELILEILDLLADAELDDSIGDVIRIRGNLRLVCPFVCKFVQDNPRFWRYLIISPGLPLDFVVACLSLAKDVELRIAFIATDGRSNTPLSSENVPCLFRDFVVDAAELLRDEMYRCAELRICADTASLVDEILSVIEPSSPLLLRAILLSFRLSTYSDFHPWTMRDYRFASCPPLGDPFPPATALSWAFEPIQFPTVNYSHYNAASCWVIHPSDRPATWLEAMTVLTSSQRVGYLFLDGIVFHTTPSRIQCSPAFYSLRVLDLTFRGSTTMAALVSCLNIPSLGTLKVNLLEPTDVSCLTRCGAILSTVKELVLIGACPPGQDYYTLFSMLHRVVRLDLRLTSNVFFNSFAYTSRLDPPSSGPNWNACPDLRRLLLHGISLAQIRAVLLQRQDVGFAQVEYVMAGNPSGGWDVTTDSWFQSQSIELVTSE